MDVVVWVASIVLAVMMLGAGATKLIRSQEQLKSSGQMDWVEDFTPGQVKAIGALEVAAALGLVLPWALDVAPILTPLAAVGVALLMAGAAVTHLRRGEPKALPINLVIMALAVFVAVTRFAD